MKGSILCFSLLPAPSPLPPPFCTCHQELGLGYGFLMPSLSGGRGEGVLWISMTSMIEWGQKSKLKKIPRGFKQNPKKSLDQNLTPKQSHAKFPSQKGV